MGNVPVAAATPSFLEWFQSYGQVGYAAVNMLYWIIVAGAVVFAAIQFKRYVDFTLGVAVKTPRQPKPEVEIEIEDFVD